MVDDGYASYATGFGVFIALMGGFMISVGLTLQKKSHDILQNSKSKSVYRMPLWWIGSVCLACGEIFNFVAFAFAPASLLTPLGGWSVFIAGILAYRFLGERLTRDKILGFILCISGTLLILLVFPKQIGPGHVVSTASQLNDQLHHTSVCQYLVGQLLLCAALVIAEQTTRLAEKTSFVYLVTCSISEGVSIVCAKMAALLLRESIESGSLLYLVTLIGSLLMLVLTLPLQIIYLNKAMAKFGNTEVIPRHYVLFTFTSCAGAQVVFREFDTTNIRPVGFLLAILVTSVGINLVAKETPEEGGKQSRLPS